MTKIASRGPAIFLKSELPGLDSQRDNCKIFRNDFVLLNSNVAENATWSLSIEFERWNPLGLKTNGFLKVSVPLKNYTEIDRANFLPIPLT